jgi:hypothetical protein
MLLFNAIPELLIEADAIAVNEVSQPCLTARTGLGRGKVLSFAPPI